MAMLHVRRPGIGLVVGLMIGLILAPVILLIWAERLSSRTVLYDSTSEFGRIIVEEDRSGVRYLSFGRRGAVQSAIDPAQPERLQLPYTRALVTALALIDRPERILMVGLGGGAIPHFVQASFPDARMDVIEIDPEVVTIAARYFALQENDRIRILIGDGRQLIENPDSSRRHTRYDVILLDAYDASSVPLHLTTLEFLQSVRSRLATGGVVAANVWGPSTNRYYDAMLRTYQEAFVDVRVLKIRDAGSRIILASDREFAGEDVPFFQWADVATRIRRVGIELQTVFEVGPSRPAVSDAGLLRDP